MLIRKAIPTDNGQLAQLTAMTPMDGTIGLRIDRHPDFFGLLKERGNFIVWVAEDNDGSIIGSFSVTKELFNICGEKKWIFYLGDLKIHPSYRGSNLAFRLVKQMYRQLVQDGADLLLCNAAEGNAVVMDFFRGRAGIPEFIKVADFTAYQLIPRRCRRADNKDAAGLTGLAGFYDDFYATYVFHPVIGHLDTCIHFINRKEQAITSAVSVFDPYSLKQHVLRHYSPATAIMLGWLRMLRPFLDLSPIPRKGESLRILYVKYLGFAYNRENELRYLLRQVRNYAFTNNYHLISIAADEKDHSVRKIVEPLSRFVFRSFGLMASLKNSMPLVRDISRGIVYEDFSLL
jgi:ribosomal protein S18 acetylase RimI-like enzyme